MMPLSRASSTPGLFEFGVPDVQSGSIHALRHDLVNVLGHDCAIRLAVEHEHFDAIFFLGIFLRLGGLCLVEHIAQVRYEERNLLDFLAAGASAAAGLQEPKHWFRTVRSAM